MQCSNTLTNGCQPTDRLKVRHAIMLMLTTINNRDTHTHTERTKQRTNDRGRGACVPIPPPPHRLVSSVCCPQPSFPFCTAPSDDKAVSCHPSAVPTGCQQQHQQNPHKTLKRRPTKSYDRPIVASGSRDLFIFLLRSYLIASSDVCCFLIYSWFPVPSLGSHFSSANLFFLFINKSTRLCEHQPVSLFALTIRSAACVRSISCLLVRH